MQVWYLQTRLGPGPGKIMNPAKLGECTVSVGLARRIRVSEMVHGKVTLAILGSRVNDVLIYVEVGGGAFEVKNEVDLHGWGGTIPDAAINIWQDSTGQIFRGKSAPSYPGWLLTHAISRQLRISKPDRQLPRILCHFPPGT